MDTALMWAANSEKEQLGVVGRLIDHGANVNIRNKVMHAVARKNNTWNKNSSMCK